MTHKALAAILCLLGCCLFPSAQSVTLDWDPPVQVAPGADFDNLKPQISLVEDSIPLVLWGSTINGRKGWIAKWNGTDFGTPTQINPSGSINAFSVEGPNLTARGDLAYLVYTTFPTSSAKTMLRSSFDAGQTWNAPVWIDSLSNDIPTFPNVAITDSGNPVVIYMRQQSNWANPRYLALQSPDSGQTWLSQVDASSSAPGGEVCDCCTPRIYTPPGRQVNVFRNNDSNLRNMWATISTDGGANFNQAVEIDTTDWTVFACPSSGPAAHFVGDSIFSVFMSRGVGNKSRIYLGAANMNDLQFGYNRVIRDHADQSAIQNYPTMAGEGDIIGVAWGTSFAGNTDVEMVISTTGPAGLWNAVLQNATDSIAGTQTYPELAYHDSIFHIVYANNADNSVWYRRGKIVPFVVGLQDEVPLAFSLAPNPSTGQTRLTLRQNGLQVRLLDILGKTVQEYGRLESNSMLIDGSSLENGMYFVQIRDESGHQESLKLVLQH